MDGGRTRDWGQCQTLVSDDSKPDPQSQLERKLAPKPCSRTGERPAGYFELLRDNVPFRRLFLARVTSLILGYSMKAAGLGRN